MVSCSQEKIINSEIKHNVGTKSLKNYYGNNSYLNKHIENYDVSSLNFKEYYLFSNKSESKELIFSNPIIINNTIYYLNSNGAMVARNFDTKQLLWEKNLLQKEELINSRAVRMSFYNNKIYITFGINKIVALNTSGEVLWTKKINAVINSSPIIDGNKIFLTMQNNKMYAIDVDNGSIKWIHYGTDKHIGSIVLPDPIVYHNYLIVSYQSGELFILDKNTGETILTKNFRAKGKTTSNFTINSINNTMVKNDILLVSTGSGKTIAIALKTLKELWERDLLPLTNIWAFKNTIYFISTNSTLYTVNLNNGSTKYSKKLDENDKQNSLYTGLIMLNGKLFIYGTDGYKVVEPSSGKIEKSVKTPYTFIDIPFSINNRFFGLMWNRGKIGIAEGL